MSYSEYFLLSTAVLYDYKVQVVDLNRFSDSGFVYGNMLIVDRDTAVVFVESQAS